jgi:hypothetical protein
MVKGLVIVDAWQKLLSRDVASYPDLRNEVRSFGTFLNQVCKIERKKGTQIIHWGEGKNLGRGIMDEIEVAVEDRVMGEEGNTRWDEVHASIDELYWCGFHFGRCVHEEADFISGEDANIVLNLSLLFPQDSWKDILGDVGEEHQHGPYPDYRLHTHLGASRYRHKKYTQMHYYLWSQKGFEEVSIQ